MRIKPYKTPILYKSIINIHHYASCVKKIVQSYLENVFHRYLQAGKMHGKFLSSCVRKMNISPVAVQTITEIRERTGNYENQKNEVIYHDCGMCGYLRTAVLYGTRSGRGDGRRSRRGRE